MLINPVLCVGCSMDNLWVLWLLIIASTGSRVIERELVLLPSKKYTSRHNVLLRALTLGSALALATAAFFALMLIVGLTLAPDFMMDAASAGYAIIGRWLPMTLGNAISVGVTLALIINLIVVPPIMKALR